MKKWLHPNLVTLAIWWAIEWRTWIFSVPFAIYYIVVNFLDDTGFYSSYWFLFLLFLLNKLIEIWIVGVVFKKVILNKDFSMHILSNTPKG